MITTLLVKRSTCCYNMVKEDEFQELRVTLFYSRICGEGPSLIVTGSYIVAVSAKIQKSFVK